MAVRRRATRSYRARCHRVDAAEPIRVELVSRPYALLDDGDVVTDAGGRRWRFEVPFWWQEHGGPAGRRPGWVDGPKWPLSLIPQDGEADSVRSAQVAAATASGSHEREVARRRELTGTKPVPISPCADDD
jgi:hypothetical protein